MEKKRGCIMPEFLENKHNYLYAVKFSALNI